jgi:hypothetical protein
MGIWSPADACDGIVERRLLMHRNEPDVKLGPGVDSSYRDQGQRYPPCAQALTPTSTVRPRPRIRSQTLVRLTVKSL